MTGATQLALKPWRWRRLADHDTTWNGPGMDTIRDVLISDLRRDDYTSTFLHSVSGPGQCIRLRPAGGRGAWEREFCGDVPLSADRGG